MLTACLFEVDVARCFGAQTYQSRSRQILRALYVYMPSVDEQLSEFEGSSQLPRYAGRREEDSRLGITLVPFNYSVLKPTTMEAVEQTPKQVDSDGFDDPFLTTSMLLQVADTPSLDCDRLTCRELDEERQKAT